MERQPLSEEQVTTFCTALENGLTHQGAAALASAPTRVFAEWIEDGRMGRDPVAIEFVRRVEEAEAKVENILTSVILQAAKKGDVKAAMFWLQSRRRAYMQKVNIDSELGVVFEAIAKFAPPDVEKNILAAITVQSEG
jgi:hypothetical protein